MVTRYRPREVDYGFDDDVRRPAIGTQAQTAGQETERSSPSRLGGNVGMDGRERCLSDEDPMAVFRGRMIDHWGPENRRRKGQRPGDRPSTTTALPRHAHRLSGRGRGARAGAAGTRAFPTGKSPRPTRSPPTWGRGTSAPRPPMSRTAFTAESASRSSRAAVAGS